MPKLLTLLASTRNPPPAAETQDQKDLATIGAALQKTAGADHKIVNVHSLGAIKNYLKNNPVATGEKVQIVGHATPGRLLLEFLWTGKEYDENDSFVLDSNLFRHGALTGAFPPGASVAIIGCNVAEDRLATSVADGPTLLFDLARLWGCPVSGPVTTVGLSDFGNDGAYNKPDRLAVAHSRTVSVAADKPVPELDSDTQELSRMVEVLEMKVLGNDDDARHRQKVLPLLTKIWPTRVRALKHPEPLLAFPEVIARLEDGSRAMIMANATIIRVEREGAYTDFSTAGAAVVQRRLRSAFAQFL